jgi:C-terminal processing protease CtpA/Prc
MKTILTFLAAVALLPAVGPLGGLIPARAVAQDKPATAAQPTTAPTSAPFGGLRPANALAKKAADKDEDAIPKALIDASRRSFIAVEISLKKDASEPLSSDEMDYRISQLYEEYVDQKRPAETAGLVLDDKGRVLIFDAGLDDRYIAGITIVAGDKSFPARQAKLLYGAPGIILQADANAAAQLTPLAFSPLAGKGANTVLYQSAMYRMDDQWRLRFGLSRPSVPMRPGGSSNVFYGDSVAAGASSAYGSRFGMEGFLHIVADANGLPVGCATLSFFDLQQTQCLWRGPDLIAAEGMDWEKLTAAETACRARMLASVHEVVLVLRQGEEDDTNRYSSRGSAAGREISVYGLAVNDTDVLVLQYLDSKVARQIEKIYIKHSPTSRQEVQFVGAFKEIGGFLVRLTKGKLPARVELASADAPRMKPFWTARLRKRLGEKYVDLSTNRLYGELRGYRGRYFWYPARQMPQDSFMVDFDGRIVGAFMREKRENEEERRLDESQRHRGASDACRVFSVSELRGLLAEPAAHLDAKVEVTTKTLARRRAWLGVEFVPVTPKLSEMLKVETPTRDGQIGFIINAVYDASPAETMKLQVGDILLKLQGPGMPYPIELAGRFTRDGEFFGGRSFGGGGGGEEEDEGDVEPTWKNRRNFLTQALDAVGVGKTVSLTCYHPTGEGKGETRTIDYRIKLAPPDQDSAPKWKNRKLGLTVKDVTYEVRHALSLKAPAGVLVAKVESGSPILVAKIFTNEIITRLDDQPLTGARQMRDLLAAARKAGREKVRVTVLRLGKTRQADLAINEYDPADDEGLDEE